MLELTAEEKNTLYAFIVSFELYGSGWHSVAQGMREDFDISGREAPAIRARCANRVCSDIKPVIPDLTVTCRLRKK